VRQRQPIELSALWNAHFDLNSSVFTAAGSTDIDIIIKSKLLINQQDTEKLKNKSTKITSFYRIVHEKSPYRYKLKHFETPKR
jgi:hypothetical protein